MSQVWQCDSVSYAACFHFMIYDTVYKRTGLRRLFGPRRQSGDGASIEKATVAGFCRSEQQHNTRFTV
jgi:hypothetical protein